MYKAIPSSIHCTVCHSPAVWRNRKNCKKRCIIIASSQKTYFNPFCMFLLNISQNIIYYISGSLALCGEVIKPYSVADSVTHRHTDIST